MSKALRSTPLRITRKATFVKIEMVTTQISVPDDDPSDIEIVVKREDDLIVVGFFGYAAVDQDKRYGWQIYLTPDKADLLMRGLQDLGGASRKTMRSLEDGLYRRGADEP